MIVTYKARSLSDLADLFKKKSEECKGRAEHSKLQRGARELKAEASAWENASNILRATTIEQE